MTLARTVRTRVVVSLVLVAGSAAALRPVLAQVAPPSPATAEAPPPEKLQPFVVTGSYIPSTETAVEAGASPLLRFDRKLIEESGATTTAELLQKVTVANARAVPVSNNATGFTPGATAISLRGLGPEATLVLINGRRVAPYPVGVGGTTAFVDLNSIPLAALDTIEVLKDGASALYGADAVAGVINLRLRRGLQGAEAHVSYGNTTHRDAAEKVANLAVGTSTDRLSLLVGLNYFEKAAIMNRDRHYSAAPPFLSSNASPFNLQVSRFAVAAALGQAIGAPIRGVSNFEGVFFAQSGADAGNTGTRPASQYTYSPGRSATFNPNEYALSYPASERLGALVIGERKVFGTDHVRAYGELSYQQVRTENELAPSATGDFSTPGQAEMVIPARTPNPILTLIDPFLGVMLQVPAGTFNIPNYFIPGPGTRIVNGVAQRLAVTGAYNPFNPFNQDIAGDSRGRLAEFGNRILRNETGALLLAAGLKGENVAGRWNFDASLSYSSIRDKTRHRMNSVARFNQLVNAAAPIFTPGGPGYLGTSTPYNPFGYYRNPGATPAALVEYGRVLVRDRHESSLGQGNLVGSTRELVTLPAGPVGFAFGGEFRRERLDQHPDPIGAGGDIIGNQPAAVTRARREIGGVFAEVRVPVLRPLEATASLRHERFLSSHRDATVPKFGLRWQPLARQLTVRSSFSRGFREPSLFELYSSPISVLTPIVDPRDGFVEPEQPVVLRGNRRLAAEKTEYFNAGFVWSPTTPRLKGVSLGADFWVVTRDGTVEANPQNTVNRGFGLVPGGLLAGEDIHFSSSGGLSLVEAVFYNVGRTQVEGWDLSGGYQLPTDALGRWEISTVWTRVTRFDRAAVLGAPLRSVLGVDSTGVGADGYLKLKGRVQLSWAYRGLGAHLVGHYTDGFADLDPNGDPYQVKDRFLVDTHWSYSFRDSRRPRLRDTKVAVGVRNLFDWDPPQAYGGGANTTGYPGYLYTAENRFWYVSLGRKF